MPDPEQSIADSLGALLLRSFRTSLTLELVDGLADPVDSSTYPVLSGVARLAPVRVATLAEEIGLERSVVARRSARLLEAGLLTSTSDPAAARARLLALAPEGERVVAVMRERLVAGIARHLDDWPARDRAALARLLARFTARELAAGPPPAPGQG